MIVLDTKMIEFGDGDVGVGIAIKNGIGMVGFTDLDKQYEIGELPENKKENKQVLVSLNFKKVESIDVVINALEKIKKLMQKETKEIEE